MYIDLILFETGSIHVYIDIHFHATTITCTVFITSTVSIVITISIFPNSVILPAPLLFHRPQFPPFFLRTLTHMQGLLQILKASLIVQIRQVYTHVAWPTAVSVRVVMAAEVQVDLDFVSVQCYPLLLHTQPVMSSAIGMRACQRFLRAAVFHLHHCHDICWLCLLGLLEFVCVPLLLLMSSLSVAMLVITTTTQRGIRIRFGRRRRRATSNGKR